MDSSSLIKKFFGTAGLKLIASGLSIVSGIIIARYLGPEKFGMYGYVISIITLFSLPAIAGLPNFIVREVAKLNHTLEYEYLNGIIRWSTIYIIIMSIGAIITAFLVYEADLFNGKVIELILCSILIVPFKSLVTQKSAILNGFGKPVWSQIPLGILPPSIFIFFILSCSILNYHISVGLLLQLFTVSYALSLIFAQFLVIKCEYNLVKFDKRKYKTKEWCRSLLPFSIIAIVSTLNNELASVFLGWFGHTESVAYFRVSIQAMSLVAISLVSVNAVIMPTMAKLYQKRQIGDLQQVATKSVRLSALIAFPILAVLVIWGNEIIVLFFGKEYLPSYASLIILCVGQCVNVLCGSVGTILSMMGKEKFVLKGMLLTLIVTIVLLCILVPIKKDIGAAIAVSVGLVIWNILMSYDLLKLTGLKSWLR